MKDSRMARAVTGRILPRSAANLLQSLLALQGSRKWIFSNFLLLCMATRARADDGDEFSNNLFSDLAPLLALFGEHVAKQYLSHSTHWLEHIIFACAPLGIITAVSSAIRVGGSRPLKAMIGRAKEPFGQAEIELMSSTSSDVCEMWNGIGIVRVAGSPHILEVIINEQASNETTSCGTSQVDDEDKEHPQYSRINYLMPAPGPGIELGLLGSLMARTTNNVSEDLDDVTETTLLYREDVNVPPCIALNTTDDSVGKVELVVITIFGLLLQSGLLVFDAMTVYYWGWKKGGDDIATYAFPLVLVGTLILSIGMFLCAFVIDSSTVEKTYPISDEAKKQIVWLQKGQTVNDQRFRSYAIFAAKGRNKIVTSHRATDKDLGSLTTVASIVSIFGFIAQFIGLRAMHFSASLAQLIAIGIMTAIRIILRRNISMSPDESKDGQATGKSYTVTRLPEGYELDSMSKRTRGCGYWSVDTHRSRERRLPNLHNGPRENIEEVPDVATGVVKARVTLASLAGPDWESAVHDTANKLSGTISTMMDLIWNSSDIELATQKRDLEKFSWNVCVLYQGRGSQGPKQYSEIKMVVSREKIDNTWGPWIAATEEIVAVLNLWMYQLESEGLRGTESGDTNLWLLQHTDDLGQTDAGVAEWWITRGTEPLDVPRSDLEETLSRHKIPKERILSCFDIGEVPSSLNPRFKAMLGYSDLPTMCGQYLLYRFMTAISGEITALKGSTLIEPGRGRHPILLRHEAIHALAEAAQRSALAKVEVSYIIVVCALYHAGKLPDPTTAMEDICAMLGKAAKQPGAAGDGAANGSSFNTAPALPIYDQLFSLLQKNMLKMSKQGKLKEVWEKYIEAERTFKRHLGSAPEYTQQLRREMIMILLDNDKRGVVKPAERPDENETRVHLAARHGSLMDIYKLLKHQGQSLPDLHKLNGLGDTPLDNAARNKHCQAVRLLLLFGANIASKNQDGRNAIHKAVLNVKKEEEQENSELIETLLVSDTTKALEERDRFGFAPLHLAAQAGLLLTAKILFKYGARTNHVEGPATTPLHLAAEFGHEQIVRLLLEHEADFQHLNHENRTALHEAAEKGHDRVVALLLDRGASLQVCDGTGATPLQLAVWHEHAKVVNLLVSHGADINANPQNDLPLIHKIMVEHAEPSRSNILRLLHEHRADMDTRNREGHTLLFQAALHGDIEMVSILLELGANMGTLQGDSFGGMAIHAAASQGHMETVKMLLQRGADINQPSKFGWTTLQALATDPEIEMPKFFLENNANPNTMNADGDTPLSTALKSYNLNLFILLLESGADASIHTSAGESLLVTAVNHQQYDAINLLLQRAPKSINDQDKADCLVMASIRGELSIVRLLLDEGVHVDSLSTVTHGTIEDGAQRSSFLWACRIGAIEAAELLLSRGANIDQVDIATGMTGLQLASSYWITAVLSLLLRHGATTTSEEKEKYESQIRQGRSEWEAVPSP